MRNMNSSEKELRNINCITGHFDITFLKECLNWFITVTSCDIV